MELHARPELAAQYRMVDDASGDVKVGKHMQTNTVQILFRLQLHCCVLFELLFACVRCGALRIWNWLK